MRGMTGIESERRGVLRLGSLREREEREKRTGNELRGIGRET